MSLAPADPDSGPLAHPEVRLVERAFLISALEAELSRLSLAGIVGPVREPGRGARVMVAAAEALEAGDLLFGTARDWPAALCRGVSAEALLLHAAGRAAEPSLGRGLPGALNSRDAGVSLSDSGPAAHLPHALGFGVAARVRRSERVALALLGVGAFAYGDTHEALRAAVAHGAHTVFVVRGPRGDEPPLVESAAAWGISVLTPDADSGVEVYRAAREAGARARSGRGPTLIDARHGDDPAIARDLLALQRAGRLSSESLRAVKAEVRAALWAARQAMDAAPALDPATLLDHLRAPAPDRGEPS